MDHKAVIFDMDGTLLNTLDDLADAMNCTLEKRGLPTHPVEAFRFFVGNGAINIVYRTLPQEQRNNDVLVNDCVEAFLKEYRKNWHKKTRLYDGISELLDALTEREIPISIFTNKPQEFAERCVQAFLPKWHFEAVIGQIEGRPMKPEPIVPIKIAKQLNIPPEQFLYLGDSDADMQTAVNANMLPIGVLWGFRPEKELKEAGAVHLIRHPMDLLTLL